MKRLIKAKHKIRWILPLGMLLILGGPVMAEQTKNATEAASIQVKKAVMCENVQDGLPVNQTIIFSVSNAWAYCWSELDPVPADGIIYHKWYRKGALITSPPLEVHPPRWATYSRWALRQADIGPWHLNITDENGNILKTLRFSITE